MRKNPRLNFPISLAGSLIEMIAANGNQIDSRIRLQKFSYLLKCIGAESFAGVRFDYEAHGPYSREVSDALQEIIAAGLVEETREESDDGTYRYSYKLTKQGEEWLQENLSEHNQCLKSAVDHLKEKPISVLELSSRVMFLNDRGIEDEERAFNLAVQQNPKLDSPNYQTQAKNFIQSIKTTAIAGCKG